VLKPPRKYNPYAICRAMQNRQKAAGKEFGKKKYDQSCKAIL
jgi:hypothetical protein